MADVLDIDNAEDFEVDDDGDREFASLAGFNLKNENENIFRGNFEAERKGKEKEGPWIWS